jgi:hypothetical protein
MRKEDDVKVEECWIEIGCDGCAKTLRKGTFAAMGICREHPEEPGWALCVDCVRKVAKDLEGVDE